MNTDFNDSLRVLVDKATVQPDSQEVGEKALNYLKENTMNMTSADLTLLTRMQEAFNAA